MIQFIVSILDNHKKKQKLSINFELMRKYNVSSEAQKTLKEIFSYDDTFWNRLFYDPLFESYRQQLLLTNDCSIKLSILTDAIIYSQNNY